MAGCTHATALLKAYLLRSLDAVARKWPTLRLRNMVDDVGMQAIGTRDIVIKCVGEGTNDLVARLRNFGLQMADKGGIVTKDSEVARALEGKLAVNGLKRRLQVRLLGIDYSAAGRRAAATRGKRIKRFVSRKARYRAIRLAGGNASKLVRTGGLQSALWGCGVDGISDAQLHRIRTTAGVATRSVAAGRSLTIDLALSAAEGPGEKICRTVCDPFVSATIKPAAFWARAVWSTRWRICNSF